MFDAHLGAVQQKKARIEQQAQAKRDYLDPEYKFNVNDVGIVDADTVEIPSGERVRLTAGEGYALDAYETNPDVYEQRPAKERAHKKSYAEAFGLDIDDVTREDLIIAGESQKAKFKERLLKSADADGNISFRNRGQGADGRILGELDRDQINLSGRTENAGYEGKFNFLQRLEDFASGETAAHQEGAGDRSIGTVAKDQGVNLAVGATRMINDLAQSVGVVTGVNKIPGVDAVHHKVREGIEGLKERFNSPEQLRAERLAQSRNALQSELYNVQRQKYLDAGSSEVNASIRAGIDEFKNAVGNLIDNPGQILDKTVESLPYMLGVAAVGRKATTVAIRKLQNQILKGTIKKAGGKVIDDAAIATWNAQRTKAFLATHKGQAYLRKVSATTGISTVGLTEGLSTSAEVYDSIRNMSEAEALNSDKYVQLRESGMSHEQATRELAEDAHMQTLLSVTLAAGVAAAGTGAGAFESQLFTGLGGTSKRLIGKTAKAEAARKTAEQAAAKAAKQAEKGSLRKLAEKPIEWTAKYGKFVGPAGAKEAAEETLQSGGGEFLSQLASFEATGEQVGPGVGAAAGEGFIVGLASGAGMQTLFGGLKAIGTMDPRKIAAAGQKWKESKKAQIINKAPENQGPIVSPETEETINNAGSQTPEESEASTAAIFETKIADLYNNLEDPEISRKTLETYLELREVAAAAKVAGNPISDHDSARLEVLREGATDALTRTIQKMEEKPSTEYDADDIKLLAIATELGLEVDTSKLTEDQKAIVESSAKLAESFNKLEDHLEAEIDANPKQESAIRKVWNEKFGPGHSMVGGVLRPGLGWYRRTILHAMNKQTFTANDDSLNATFAKLRNFRKTQFTKLQNARTAVAEKRDVGSFKYVEKDAKDGVAGSEAMLAILEAEDKEMQNVVSELSTRWEHWRAASVATPTSAVPARTEAAPEGTTAPQPTAAPKTKVAPKQRVAKGLEKIRKELEGVKMPQLKKLAEDRGISVSGKTYGAILTELAAKIANERASEAAPKPKTTKKAQRKAKYSKPLRTQLERSYKELGLGSQVFKNILSKMRPQAVKSGDIGLVKRIDNLKERNNAHLKIGTTEGGTFTEPAKKASTKNVKRSKGVSGTKARSDYANARNAELDAMTSRQIVNIAKDLGLKVPDAVNVGVLMMQIIEKELEDRGLGIQFNEPVPKKIVAGDAFRTTSGRTFQIVEVKGRIETVTNKSYYAQELDVFGKPVGSVKRIDKRHIQKEGVKFAQEFTPGLGNQVTGAKELLATGQTGLGIIRPSILSDIRQELVDWVKGYAKASIDELLQLLHEEKPDRLFGDEHNFIYRFGWVPIDQTMLNNISNHIGDRPVIMPAAGLGFMARLLQEKGHTVIASDQHVAPHAWTDIKKQDAVDAARNAPENSVLFVAYPEMVGEDFMADVIDAFKGEEIIYQGLQFDIIDEPNLTLNPKAQEKLSQFEATEVSEPDYDTSSSYLIETTAFDVRKENTGEPHFKPSEQPEIILTDKLAEEFKEHPVLSREFTEGSNITGIEDEGSVAESPAAELARLRNELDKLVAVRGLPFSKQVKYIKTLGYTKDEYQEWRRTSHVDVEQLKARIRKLEQVVPSTQPEQAAPSTQPAAADVAGQPTTIRQAVADGLTTALDFIISQSKTPHAPALATRIKEQLAGRDIKVVLLSQSQMVARYGNPKAKGAWAAETQTIYLNKDKLDTGFKFQNTLLHEATHAGIDGWLDKNKDSALYEELRKFNNEVVLALLASNTPLHTQMASILQRSPEELLTHGINSPELQTFLQNMKIEDTTAWSRFVQMIAEILGLANNTGLHRVLSLTEAVFQETKPGVVSQVPSEKQGLETQINELAGRIEQVQADLEAAYSADADADIIDGLVAEETELVNEREALVRQFTSAEADAQAQPEQEAEGDTAIQEELAQRDIAVRLSEVRRLRTLLEAGVITESEFFLSNEEDMAFLTRLLEADILPYAAFQQLLANINPDPTTNPTVETTVNQENIDKVVTNAAILNDRDSKKEVEARPIPERLRNFKNILEGAVERITRLFDKFKLPLTLSDAFELRNKKVRDLLASEDFVMTVLADPGAREQFFDRVGVNPAEQRALTAFAEFAAEFYNTLAANFRTIKPTDIANQSPSGNGIGVIDENLLPYFQDENGNLDHNIVSAMALEALQWLTTRGAQTVSNSESDVRAMFGLTDSDYITADMWRAGGRGTVRTAVGSQIGYKSLAHVNLKAKPNAKPLIREKLALAMGAQTLATLAQMKVGEEPLIKQHEVTRQHWNEMVGTEGSEETTGEGNVVLVRNNTIQPEMDYATGLFPHIDINTDLREAVQDGRQIFTKLFASTSSVRTPVFEVPQQNDVPTKVSRSLSKIPKLMRDRMLVDMQKHYEMDTEVMDLIARLNPERFLEMAHGYTTPAQLEQKHVTERRGLEGKNAGLVRDLTEAQSWQKRYGSKIFYLPQKMIRSGRVYIDSNVINPQASKLHRFMFVREGWRRNITKAAPSALTGTARTQYEKMMMAVGLGLGIKIAEYTRADVTRMVEAYFAEGGMGREALNVLTKAETESLSEEDYAALERVISKEGTHTLAALNAYMKWDNAQTGDVVSIALPNESDGTTNGYIMGLMQTPPATIDADYKALLNAGGIFFEGDPWTTWAEYKEDGGLDNYQHIAKDTRTNLQLNKKFADNAVINSRTKNTRKRQIFLNRQLANVWASRIVPNLDELKAGMKEGRDWSKDPLLVSSYGSGTESVVKAMIAKAIEQFYINMAEARNGSAQEIANAINAAYGLANMYVDASNKADVKRLVRVDGEKRWVPYERVGTSSADGYYTAEEVQAGADEFYNGDLSQLATEFVVPKIVLSHMGNTLKETYGLALAEALDTRLAPVKQIRKLMNAANKISNVLYVADYNRRVLTLENDKGNRLTPSDRQKIREDMMREGLVPVIGTAASNGIEDSLETTNYETEYYKTGNKLQRGLGVLQNKRQLAEIRYGQNNEKTVPAPYGSLTINLTAQTPSTDIGVAAGVIGIHAIDGVNNSAAWGREGYAVGNIHDAELSPWWAADDVAGIVNGDFGNIHANYSLPDQFLKTVIRMTASLYSPQDSRLSQGQKDTVAKTMLEYESGPFGALNIDWPARGVNPVVDPVLAGNIVINELISELQFETRQSLFGKTELLKDIRVIAQYAMPNGEAVFPNGIETATEAPTQFASPQGVIDRTASKTVESAWHLQEPMTGRQLVDTMREYLTRNTPTQDKAIDWFKAVLANEDADVGEAFRSYLEHPSTDAESTLDMLANAYTTGTLGRQLKLLNNILKPYLSEVGVERVGEEKPFADRTRTIYIADDSKNPVADFMNRALYAASLPKLQEMQENNPERYEELRKEAFDRAKGFVKRKEAGVARVGREIIQYEQLDQSAKGIATYISRTLSAQDSNDLTQYGLFFPNSMKEFAGLTANLQAALRAGESSNTVLYDESINDNQDPNTRYDNLHESEKIGKMFADLATLEQTPEDPNHQEHLRTLVEELVVPGLTSIEPILQEVRIDNEATINVAETIQLPEVEGDIIRLTAAGNALTNNVDSSIQEKAANEYVHHIISHAHDTNHFIRKETRRLFEIAQEGLTWSDLMPAPENLVGDPQIAEERAKERFDWIFNNPDPNLGYKAFISIGVTNAQFATALSNIDNPSRSFKAPRWSDGILRALMTIVRQAVGALSGTSLRTEGGSLKDATRALAQATVAVNQRTQERIKEAADGPQGNQVQRLNAGLVRAVNDRLVEPLGAGLASINRKRLDPDNPTLPGFFKSATYVALRTRDSEVRREYNNYYRSIANEGGFGKDNSFFEILSEITPWDDSKMNWVDLLRKSKYMVDMARQEATEHTRSFIMDSFDKNNYMSQAHKRAITKTILKTDIASLIDGEHGLELDDLVRLLNDKAAVATEITRLEAALRAKLDASGLADRFHYFRNQYKSLGVSMVTGKHAVGNPMLNAHNIVQQYFLPTVSQKKVADPEVVKLVDSLASLHALQRQEANDLKLTRDIVNHEVARTDQPGDNGFTRLIGQTINFKELSQQILFKNNPVQMQKGYVYELFDGDVNITIVQDGSPQQAQAEAQGMTLVGPLQKDALDKSPTRYLYKGLKGLATYNKAIVSLTDLQHSGANLFSVEGYKSDAALKKLHDMRRASFREAATNQSKPDYIRKGNNTVPILDDQGNIVDYRYIMSENTKEKVLKKQDPFDRVLPHMFGSLKDRPATVDINRRVVDLLVEEYRVLQDDPGYRFVEIARDSEDDDTREMWRLLPEDMRRYAASKFGAHKIMIRDDVVNMVLGYRKLSVLNIKDPTGSGSNIWGKGTPIARIAEKTWLETVSLMRIKIAILTPAVVVGNIASNVGMLLSEGIPADYIRKNASEAISAMRQYQKDRKTATELDRLIGSHAALGKDTRQLELKLGRLEAELQANPVGQLVKEGLFTSIAADLGVDDDTIRGSLIQKVEDLASGNRVPGAVVKGVKELYMLPGSKGYRAAVAATQYGDFVARYVKVKYDTQEKGVDVNDALRDALRKFIYYDIPMNKYMQAASDFGPFMFPKFFLRIQSVVAEMFAVNPVSAVAVLGLQRGLLPVPFNENIANYGLGEGGLGKFTAPWNLPSKVATTLNPLEPASVDWFLNPFGL
jgi:hypothetical protein